MPSIEQQQQIKIGSFVLSEGYGGPESIAIYCAAGDAAGDAAGEGGDFPVAALEAVIRKFYEENF